RSRGTRLLKLRGLEIKALIRAWKPFDTVLNSVRMDLVIKRRIRQILCAQLQYLANDGTAFGRICLRALLLNKLLHLGIDPIKPTGLFVQASQNQIGIHDRRSIGEQMDSVQLSVCPKREECGIFHALKFDIDADIPQIVRDSLSHLLAKSQIVGRILKYDLLTLV